MFAVPPVKTNAGHPGEATRRRALQLLSSSMAVALARCGTPLEQIVPYVDMPERLVAGEPRRYATALPFAGYGRGVIGITVDGRPIKIEGNPSDTYNGGGTDVFAEAEILSLYDPDRSRAPQKDGIVASWEQFGSEWENAARAQIASGGAGIALVGGRMTSPTLLRMVQSLKTRFPALRQYRYEPVSDDFARAGSRQAFGRRVDVIHRIDDADVLIVLDADPLGPGPNFLHNASRFAARRGSGRPQRIHVAESGLTLMGAMADHRISISPKRIGAIAGAIAQAMGFGSSAGALSENEMRFVRAAASDLKSGTGRGLVLAGDHQPANLHALAHFLNGQSHAPVDLIAPLDPDERDHAESFAGLVRDLKTGSISTLIVMDANPVYDSPDSGDIARPIRSVPFSVHCGVYENETADACHWHLSLSHSLETWGDLKRPDGATLLMQPLIRPLYDTRSAAEVLNLLAAGPAAPLREIVRTTWMAQIGQDFEQWWRESLTAGLIANLSPQPLSISPAMPAMQTAQDASSAFTLTLAPSPTVWDGRYANNAWLQECPAPFTKEVWGNAVQMAPEDAKRAGISSGDGIVLRRGNVGVEAVAVVLNGQPQGTAKGFIGQGRWRAGDIGSGVGARITALAGVSLDTMIEGVSIWPNGKSGLLHTTQYYTRLEGRDEDIFPMAPAERIVQRLAELRPDTGGIVPALPANEYAWAMVIDNDLCIGCNACVIACQAENNVGVVGPHEVDLGRDMHWLRIDVYELDEPDGLRRGFQPVPCMHCETAPCEPVCPVAASVHDHEGLNVQVYNRCIGTRFCESNCPYKVRRFNFFGYTKGQEYGNLGQPPVRAQRNPNVSVRGRGVMEKCTYCVQRISSARKTAEKENRMIREGEVVTACAAACPTRAIHFGNRNDANSEVAKLQDDPRHYALLGHLDTRPRTTYLAKVYHPNPQPEGQTG